MNRWKVFFYYYFQALQNEGEGEERMVLGTRVIETKTGKNSRN